MFYRLEVIRITIPPLRERKEDIVYYIDNMLGKMGKKIGREVTLGEDALKILKSYDYPGNIRELENIIERAVVMDEDGIITKKDLPLYVTDHDVKSGSQLSLQYQPFSHTGGIGSRCD